MGAIIGCAHDDIKKVLAASTMSQIGYMMLAVGIGPGAYALGIIHLLAHGFFKANMFLGAGSVMHGMNDEVEHATVRRPAQGHADHLRTFTCGYLAIIGCSAVRRLLDQGQDHRGGVRQGRHVGLDLRLARRCSAPASPRST